MLSVEMMHGEAMMLEASLQRSGGAGKTRNELDFELGNAYVSPATQASARTMAHAEAMASPGGATGSGYTTSSAAITDYDGATRSAAITRVDAMERAGAAQPEFPPNPTLLYDGTIEGYYTAVFTAFEHKLEPGDICTEDNPRLSLFSQAVTIETSPELAWRVDAGLRRKLGADESQRIRLAYLSDEPGHELDLFRYIRLAMRKGRYAFCEHTNPIVESYENLWRQVSNERHRMLQFTRFAEVEGGVYFAKVNPSANVVPVMMEHFARRFNTQPFVIYDEVHKVAGVSRDGAWTLVNTDGISVPNKTEREEAYSQMWRSFYDSICNQERLNPALRRTFMPMRLWRNITEMQPAS